MECLFKEYYCAGATYLLSEALKEICNSHGKVKNAVTVMAKKHYISTKRSGGAEHNTSSFTIIQKDVIIHTEHLADDENGPNSHINSNSLNTVTNR
ncbi:20552_t:CDS:2 [Cetraspora pellucida]|uniref:20552_t:CDS:1 n=1 Tax=Cetraspora pellucida TaxID=1433469 RepID=A0A9N9H1T8_9GLOM|nr:20552_t:CDS:2 [Cetraspora pellucida]